MAAIVKTPKYTLPKTSPGDTAIGYRYSISEAQRQAVAHGLKHVCHELRRRGFKVTPNNNRLYEVSRGKVTAEVHLSVEHAENHCPRATLTGGWGSGQRRTKQFPARRDYNAWVCNVVDHVAEAYESRVARDAREDQVTKAKRALAQRLREALDTAGFDDAFHVNVDDRKYGRTSQHVVEACVRGKDTTGELTIKTAAYPPHPGSDEKERAPEFEAVLRVWIDPERDLPELHKLLTGHRATLKVQVKT